MTMPSPGVMLHCFFVDHLVGNKGLRPSSVASYRDVIRLFLRFVAKDTGRKVTKLQLQELTAQRVLRFLNSLETERRNGISTRNHRLVILRAFFEYLGARVPEALIEAEKVALIPTKRTPPPATYYLDRNEIERLFASIPADAWGAERDTVLLLFLYNTGARAQEVADLRVGNLELDEQPRVRLYGKGDKWRVCPLWRRTTERLQRLLSHESNSSDDDAPVFTSRSGRPLTRSGIYKIVRRHAARFDSTTPNGAPRRRVTPHTLRHTTAVHLLEAGVELNVIRGWLGHVKLETTNRYAEITQRAKEAALLACQPPALAEPENTRSPLRSDHTLLEWLDSL